MQLPGGQTVETLKDVACEALGLDACELFDLERDIQVDTDEQLHTMLEQWTSLEEARQGDALAATLEGIRSKLYSYAEPEIKPRTRAQQRQRLLV